MKKFERLQYYGIFLKCNTTGFPRYSRGLSTIKILKFIRKYQNCNFSLKQAKFDKKGAIFPRYSWFFCPQIARIACTSTEIYRRILRRMRESKSVLKEISWNHILKCIQIILQFFPITVKLLHLKRMWNAIAD